MKKFLLRAAFSALGLWLATRVVPGIGIDGAGTLAGAALLLGVANAIVRPVLVLLTLPITILTLGLFLFVVNAAVFGLVASLLDGFHVAGFVPALLGSLVVGCTGLLGSWWFPGAKR
jgi:putative membrane protein